jgi:DNA-binding transcriptional LysR family regulator
MEFIWNMINFNHFRVFHQVARHLNFSLAAKSLNITQPAVTVQVKLFQASCNLKLFKRSGRTLVLTDEGKVLYEYARKIFEYEREIEDTIKEMRELKRGLLRLCTSKTFARYVMPSLICKFREAYPHIEIHLDEGKSVDMANSLLNFGNELAIIAKAEENPDICFVPFYQEELVIVLPSHHHLAHKKAISMGDLLQEQIIMKEKGSGTRKVVDELFAQRGLTTNILIETSNSEFIKELVQRGDGISFLTRTAVAAEVKEKKLAAVPFKGKRVFLEVSVAYLKSQQLSPPAQAFLDMLLEIASKEKLDQGKEFRVS